MQPFTEPLELFSIPEQCFDTTAPFGTALLLLLQ